MGCVVEPEQSSLIPPPTGPPQDPLEKEGDIVTNIALDPHINYYQNKIQQVLLPLRKAKKPLAKATSQERYATADKKEHEKYVQSINEAIDKNSGTATNILGYMIEEIADDREKGQAEKRFKDGEEYAALKCFVYLYTGNFTYKKMNQMLRRSEYEKVSAVIGVVKKQLEQYNKEKFARKLKANAKHGRFLDLFRGINKPDKLMVKGKRMYWRGCTSTSLERKIANNFGKYQYIVELDNANPHPYMVVPKDLSQFEEEEIILFPYFYCECTQVDDFVSGATYSVKQVAPENDE